MTTIQAQIDAAVAAGGGEIKLAPGDYTGEGPVFLSSHVALIGAVRSIVKIGPVSTRNFNERAMYARLDNLSVHCVNGYVGIDWRNVSGGSITNVTIDGAATALLLAYACECNTITALIASASEAAVQLYSGANQNTFVGGHLSAPIGFDIIDSNGTTATGTALEGDPEMQFVKRTGSTAGTTMHGVRCETPAYGPVWLNGVDGAW